jgi:RHS repeat-associated protein
VIGIIDPHCSKSTAAGLTGFLLAGRARVRTQPTRVYYHRNQQYSIVGLTNAAGTLVERYTYSAYGTLGIYAANGTVRSSSTYANRYTYTGREWDADLRLYHFRARWYDPATGGFVSRDPLGYVDGMSLYRGYFAVQHSDSSGYTMILDQVVDWFAGWRDEDSFARSRTYGTMRQSTRWTPIERIVGMKCDFSFEPFDDIDSFQEVVPDWIDWDDFQVVSDFDGGQAAQVTTKAHIVGTWVSTCCQCTDTSRGCHRCTVDLSIITTIQVQLHRLPTATGLPLLNHERNHIRLAQAIACSLAKKADVGLIEGDEKCGPKGLEAAKNSARIRWQQSSPTDLNRLVKRINDLTKGFHKSYDDEVSSRSLDLHREKNWSNRIESWLANCNVPVNF